MDCQDDARQRIGNDMAEKDMDKVRESFSKCLTSCVDKNCSTTDDLFKKMRDTIKGMGKSSNYN